MASVFVRVVAVLVGLSNAWVFMSGDPVMIAGDPAMLAQAARLNLLPVLLVATVAGFLTSEFLLRVMRTDLEGKFLRRYATMLLAVALGGALFGSLLPLVQLLGSPVPFIALLVDSSDPIADQIASALVAGVMGGVIGGMAGTLEGVILAFPLAAVLGTFRSRDRTEV